MIIPNSFERFLIRRSYRPTILIDWSGYTIFISLLWDHHLLLGLGTLFFCFIIGALVARKQDLYKLEATPMARAYLSLASKPLLLILFIAGTVVVSCGLWLDNYIVIGVGLTLQIGSFARKNRPVRKATTRTWTLFNPRKINIYRHYKIFTMETRRKIYFTICGILIFSVLAFVLSMLWIIGFNIPVTPFHLGLMLICEILLVISMIFLYLAYKVDKKITIKRLEELRATFRY